MKIFRGILCALLCLALLIPLSACGSESGYRIIDTYSAEGSYVIAFREGDAIAELVSAALYELSENGTLRSASNSWFGENLISLRSQSGAMDELWDSVTSRTITVGIDITNMPMSYESASGYQGFDVDLANYICGYLGWSMTLYPIDPDDVDVELNSGNIDMAMGIPQTAEVSGFSYSPAYLTSRYVLVSYASGRIRSKSSLKGKTLGVVITDLDVLQQNESFIDSLGNITYQTNTDGLFQALLQGDVDAILVSSVVAAYYMK